MYKKQQTISMAVNEPSLLLMNNRMQKESICRLAFLMTIGALLVLNQAEALSLISEKCDPNKVGPDETTVKGGWQAEMFNGLSFRTCGKFPFHFIPFYLSSHITLPYLTFFCVYVLFNRCV